MNKKGIFIVIVVIILAIVGYRFMSSKTSTAVDNNTAPAEVVSEVPAGVTKDTYAPVTKDSTDNTLLGRLKSVSVDVTEDGSKITLADGKADFTVSGSSVKGSVLLGDVAITKTVKDRTDVLAAFSVSTGSTKTAYVILFADVAGKLTDKSYAFMGPGATITGMRADDIASDGDYVVSVSYKDAKGAHTKLLVVANGEFNLAKSVDF